MREALKRIHSTLFLLFLLFNVGFAIDKCSGQHYADTISITNNQGSPVFYELNVEGNSAIFTQLSEYEFFLIAGESKTIDFETNLPFTGDYTLQITVEASIGGDTSYTYDFNVSNCHNIEVLPIFSQEYCSYSTSEYEFNVTNTGIYNETLLVNSDNQELTITIMPDETKNMNFTFFTEPMTPVTMEIQNNDINFSDNYIPNIVGCDSFDYTLIEESSLCEGSVLEKQITITNTGIHNDSYIITPSSPIIQLNNDSFLLGINESKIITITIPTEYGESGIRNENLLIDSELNGEVTVSIGYEILNCFDQTISLLTNLTEYCEHDNETMIANLKNNGLLNNTYNATLSFGQENISNVYELNSGEDINITLELIDLVPGIYLLEFISNNDILYNTFSYEIEVSDFSKCYSGTMIVEEQFYDENTIITLGNNGTRTNNYNISISAYNEIDNSSITLEAGEIINLRMNNLLQIHNEYGVESFMITMSGMGINSTQNTTFYDNRITGMIVESGANAVALIGVTLLISIVYLFIRKK